MKRMQTKKLRGQQSGFTIIELLLATVVFSMVLLLITTGIIQFTNLYYKGVTVNSTQNTARSIMDTVSQAIQFSGGTITATNDTLIPGVTGYMCVGTTEFKYVLGKQLEDSPNAAKDQVSNVMQQGSLSGACGTGTLSSIKELMGPHMRLSDFSVQPVSGTDHMYTVKVTVTYGDDDLLNSPTGKTPSCKSGSGSQFCNVSSLSTTVEKRIGT